MEIAVLDAAALCEELFAERGVVLRFWLVLGGGGGNEIFEGIEPRGALLDDPEAGGSAEEQEHG